MSVNAHFTMTWKRFLLFLFAVQSVSFSRIVQYPAVVKVFRGETVSLTCDTVELLSKCDSVSWFKVQPRTREMNVSTSVHTDQGRRLCTGFIYNTSTADSGIYYCSVRHSVISYMGNGSTVIIKERHPRPIITLYVPDVSAGPAVSLQCVVMGVVPSEASVSWVIGESEMTGWTESGWTHTNDSAVEYTRAHISIPSENWVEAQDVECVVEVDGRRVSKSLKQGELCSWLLYLGSAVAVAVAVAVVTVIIITAISLKPGDHKRTHTAERSAITEVEYTCLEPSGVAECGSAALNQNC